MKKPPSPPCLPLIGHIPGFRRDVLGLIKRSVREYGDMVYFKLGPYPIYLINHPDSIVHVLKKNAGNYDKETRSTRFLRDISGESLLTSNGEEWRKKRHHLQPAFHRQAIMGFESIIREEADVLVNSWKNQSQVNASADFTTTTFKIVARSLFGADIDRATLVSLADPITRLLTEAFTRLGSLTGMKSRKFKQALKELDTVVNSIISSRTESPGSPDLLELIRSGNPDPKYIHDESISFLLAGHETTANALSWLFAYLAFHPEEQERCSKDPAALERAFNEAMRLAPPIWIVERRALDPDEISGYPIPKNASIAICTYTVHRHPDFWEDPESFKPDRFLEPAPAAYIPFGLGPRVCIGKEFALMEARIIAGALLENYQFTPTSPTFPEAETGITLRIKNDLRLNVQPRRP
jgi:enediyne biosynthesis protein E7